jgi:hypothetical protein
MSELNNPLFENQKEFLERQKEEYKNALLSDVTELKTQSQKVGKTVLIAGGAIAGVWFLSSMLRGKKKEKSTKKLKAGRKVLSLPAAGSTMSADAVVNPDGSINYQEALNQEPVYPTNNSNRRPTGPEEHGFAYNLLHSDMAKALSQQLTAFLLIYLTKKIEEYVSKETDVVSSKDPEIRDIDYSFHEEDAV